MNWLSKLYNSVPAEKRKGIHLNHNNPQWKIENPKRRCFSELFRALTYLVPPDSIAYFEDGSPGGALKTFFDERSVHEVSHVEMGTISLETPVLHVPASSENLLELAEIAEHYAEPEVAIHFHVYKDDEMLLEWYDAFANPIFVSKELPENKIKEFCNRLSVGYETYMEGFDQIYIELVRKGKKTNYKKLKLLVQAIYIESKNRPINRQQLKETLLALVQFLSSEKGRTSPNYQAVDSFFQDAKNLWRVEIDNLDGDFKEVFDEFCFMHEAVDQPEHHSSPEQIKEMIENINI